MKAIPASTRLTRTGLASCAIAAATTLWGLVTFSGPVLGVGLAAMVLLLVCRSLALRHLEGFFVERDLPRRARAGESFPMALCLRPGSRFPAGTPVLFTDPLAPAVREKALSPDDGGPFPIRCTGLAHRRGPLPQRPWTLASVWPLGLFLTKQHGQFRDDHAPLVLPRPWLPARLHERLAQLSLESAERPTEPADPVAEFRFLREFRHGDPVRGIHWPTSLRSGRLQFAETEPPRPKPLCYGIYLHSYEAPGTIVTPETYELILRIATGLLLRFQHEGIPVVFAQPFTAAIRLHERIEFTALLEALALSQRRPFSSLRDGFPHLRESRNDPFALCDEVFVLGDGQLQDWEDAARERFPRSTCLDANRLTSASRPALKVRGTFSGS